MDPIADMLTRIRNAAALQKPTVVIPHSRLKAGILEILKEKEYIEDVATETAEDGVKKQLIVTLKYHGGIPAIRTLRRISRPGLRIYRGAAELPRPRGDFGLMIVSTPAGLMTGAEAKRRHMGGEVICEVLS
ncbi:MAG: 30S ribosomal protein S8 [Patescibacteria group bacterium]|jgi:small subunit ribosomal protein S8